MESQNEGDRIELKTNIELTISQLKKAGIKKGDKVLDLGCAAGTTSRLMSQIVGSSGQIVGVDFSEQRLEQARSCSDVGIEYRHGQGERTPADDNEFDVSWSRFLFEYLLEPENVLSEMIRVTK
ncbi:MAG TPA: methyltransferase domain-containing protein, partial [Pyrinomonadaceae bacterium]|nr:methyltransferase domain-containing protein [Pyrinomonadaceae bacterium]